MKTAYLTDKSGKIYETLVIRADDVQRDLDAMNATCKAYTEGRLWWTLIEPCATDPHEGDMIARLDDEQYALDLDGGVS